MEARFQYNICFVLFSFRESVYDAQQQSFYKKKNKLINKKERQTKKLDTSCMKTYNVPE